MGLPSGVVTFVFTDIEGSTPLFERLGDGYRVLHERHRELLRAAFAGRGGQEVGTEGDSFFVAFADASAAVTACVEAQAAMAAEPWPDGGALRVRIGVHAGSAVPVDGNYTALAVHEAARVMAAGNGGQIVVSDVIERFASTAAGVEYVDTGMHHLRGLSRPMRLFRVRAPAVPDDSRALRTTRVATSNLPVVLDSLVGRANDVAEVTKLVAASRCVTITGTGGVGKTRLAVQVASDLVDEFPDGTWFVDLHALRVGSEVAVAVASILQADVGDDALRALTTAIGTGRVLLVLDNCEHPLAAAAELAVAIISSCPNAVVLATSREAIGVACETAWRLPSLDAEAAARLLTERVARHRPGLQPSEADVAALVEISRRLDGIPLALELAAARCSAMAPAEVAARLNQRFRLLTGMRGSLSRHQTLEAAVAWSHDLLHDETRVVFRRLAAFSGGWTLADAEQVCGFGDLDNFAIADAVAALVDKSLAVADLESSPARYRFLETVRQFAQAEVVRAGEGEAVHTRHLVYFAERVKALSAEIPGPHESDALVAVECDFENFRSAFDWAESTGDVVRMVAIAAKACGPATTLGRSAEANGWSERALAAVGSEPAAVPGELHAALLLAASKIGSHFLPAASRSRERVERAHELLRESTADPELRALTASWLGCTRIYGGETTGGVQLCREAVVLAASHPAAQAFTMAALAHALLEVDLNRAEAREMLAAALVLGSEAGSTGLQLLALEGLAFEAALAHDGDRLKALAGDIADRLADVHAALAATVTANLAGHFRRAHQFASARRYAQQAVDLATASGRSTAVAVALWVAGDVASSEGDVERAEAEWRAAVELSDRLSFMPMALMARYRLIVVLRQRGAIAEARQMCDDAHPIAEQIGGLAWLSWHTLRSRVEFAGGDLRRAAELITAAAALFHGRFGAAWEMAAVVGNAAHLAAEAGLFEDAAGFVGLVESTMQVHGASDVGSFLAVQERAELIETLSAELGEARFAELRAAGGELTIADVVARITDALAPPRDS